MSLCSVDKSSFLMAKKKAVYLSPQSVEQIQTCIKNIQGDTGALNDGQALNIDSAIPNHRKEEAEDIIKRCSAAAAQFTANATLWANSGKVFQEDCDQELDQLKQSLKEAFTFLKSAADADGSVVNEYISSIQDSAHRIWRIVSKERTGLSRFESGFDGLRKFIGDGEPGENALIFSGDWRGDDYLFTSTFGEPDSGKKFPDGSQQIDEKQAKDLLMFRGSLLASQHSYKQACTLAKPPLVVDQGYADNIGKLSRFLTDAAEMKYLVFAAMQTALDDARQSAANAQSELQGKHGHHGALASKEIAKTVDILGQIKEWGLLVGKSETLPQHASYHSHRPAPIRYDKNKFADWYKRLDAAYREYKNSCKTSRIQENETLTEQYKEFWQILLLSDTMNSVDSRLFRSTLSNFEKAVLETYSKQGSIFEVDSVGLSLSKLALIVREANSWLGNHIAEDTRRLALIHLPEEVKISERDIFTFTKLKEEMRQFHQQCHLAFSANHLTLDALAESAQNEWWKLIIADRQKNYQINLEQVDNAQEHFNITISVVEMRIPVLLLPRNDIPEKKKQGLITIAHTSFGGMLETADKAMSVILQRAREQQKGLGGWHAGGFGFQP